MKKRIRKLNKYEKAYLKHIKRKYKKKKKNNFLKNILYKVFIFFKKRRKKINISNNVFLKKEEKKPSIQNIVVEKKIKEKKKIHTVNKKTSKKKKKNISFKKIFQNFSLIIINFMKDIKKITHKKIKKRRVIVKIKEKKHKKTTNKKKKSRFKIFKIFIGIIIIFTLLVFAGLFLFFSSLEIPSVDNFNQRKISNSTKIYDKTGEILLYDIHENIQRTVVPSDKISPYIKDAIVAVEDHNFYKHHGVVWKSTLRAIIHTLLSKIGIASSGSQGGSTLTQQMVKNTLLTREKTITRKMKEWVLAYKIEKKLSKDEILTTYLNEAPYGGTIYGIQEASRVFFGKPASDVSIAEAAYLASIPNLPTYYSPYGSHVDKLKERQRLVLREMKKYGYISDDEYRKALEEKVEFLPKEENYAKALHFVQYVRALLEKKYGVDMVENGGLRVITTLDYKLQQKAEKIIKKHIQDIEKDMDASNAALVAVEAKTGNIITMVGSRDYFETDGFDGNFNVATSPRQPGSSFKPFAYATAFDKGYLPESAIFDTPTQFNSRCEADDTSNKKPCYFPRNWDGKFKGGISFRNALAQSRNIPAIKVLYLAGIRNVINKAREMGISSLNKSPSFYGLNLVLGGGEVSLLEMVSAYTTFANKGVHNSTNAILKVTDVNGKVLDEFHKNGKRVFSANITNMISSILSDNIARTPLYGAHSGIYFGKGVDVAGKTGTTNDKRDAWMIGYTTDVAVGVWTGNNDNSPMKKGSKLSIQPWHDFMKIILDDDDYHHGKFDTYTIPDNFLELPAMIRGDWKGGETYIIDSVSGKLATEFTPEETKIRITHFDPHTILYSVDKDHPQIPGNSQNDPQFKNWEYGVQKYAQTFYKDMYDPNFVIPTEYDDVHGPNGIVQSHAFDFQIKLNKELYQKDENINTKISFDDISDDDVKEVRYYVNNSFVGSLMRTPFIFNFTSDDIAYLKRNNILRIIVETKNGEKLAKDIKLIIDIPEENNNSSEEDTHPNE